MPDWQTWIALGLAGGCGLWAVWRFIKPFLRRPENTCTPPAKQEHLLQITPPRPPEN